MGVQVCFGLSGNEDDELGVALAMLMPQLVLVARNKGDSKEQFVAGFAEVAGAMWDATEEMP